MIPPSISSEIETYKSQLKGFLAAKYVDQALLQGFVTVVQGKFSAWIAADLARFHALFSTGPNQVDPTSVALTDLLQVMWSQIHHPIVKSYQRLHAEILALLSDALKSGHLNLSLKPLKKGKTSKPQSLFRLVEMRKLNEAFEKLILTAAAFYASLVVLIMQDYHNPLIPVFYLDELLLKTVATTSSSFLLTGKSACSSTATASHSPAATASHSSASQTLSANTTTTEINSQDSEQNNSKTINLSDFHSTLSYVVFYCLLNLGNLTRHSALINLSYLQPGKSVTAYYKHLKSGAPEVALANKLYTKPLRYYFKCIGILPTMHEPYNHIGVIYNSFGEKFTAGIWFLRSQFTRDTATTVGRYNLHSLFSKPWLERLYQTTLHKSPSTLTASDVNNILMRVVAHHFFAAACKEPIYICKVEADLLNVLFQRDVTSHIALIPSLITDHLTMLICFFSMAEREQNEDVCRKFGNFTAKYFESYLLYVAKKVEAIEEKEAILRNLRLILAFLRKNPGFSRRRSGEFATAFTAVLDAIKDCHEEDDKASIFEAFQNSSAPVRSYYFAEDVRFKDFTPIGCQFKDFNDEHLFSCKNIDLLFGSFFYTNAAEIPSFLDNKAVLRIRKDMELEGNDYKLGDCVAQEIVHYENSMRTSAIVTMVKKLYGSRIYVEEERFVTEKVEVPTTQKQKATKKGSKNNSKKSAKARNEKVSKEAIKIASEETSNPLTDASATNHPASFSEIEQMILGHAPRLSNGRDKELRQDHGLENMVNSIVSEEKVKTNSVESLPAQANESMNEAESKSKFAHNETPTGNRAIESDAQNAINETNQSGKLNQPVHILHPPHASGLSDPAARREKTATDAFPMETQRDGFPAVWPDNADPNFGPTFNAPVQQYAPQLPMAHMPMGFYPPAINGTSSQNVTSVPVVGMPNMPNMPNMPSVPNMPNMPSMANVASMATMPVPPVMPYPYYMGGGPYYVTDVNYGLFTGNLESNWSGQHNQHSNQYPQYQ